MDFKDIKPGDIFLSDLYEAVVIGTPTPESIRDMSLRASLELQAGNYGCHQIASGILCYRADFVQISEVPVPANTHRSRGFLTLNEEQFPQIIQDYKGQDSEVSRRLLTYALNELNSGGINMAGSLGHQLNITQVQKDTADLQARLQ